MAHDVFLSFSFSDQTKAEEITNTLTSVYGISCWICTRGISGGVNFKTEIPNAIRASRVIVFLQSKQSIESREVPKEISIAFDEGKTIIPFRLDDTTLRGSKLEYDLKDVEYIDGTLPTWEERIRDLAQSILKIIKPVEALHPTSLLLESSVITCSEVFAGRDVQIEEIHDAFADNRHLVFLSGMAGIGKSELACQYWKAHRDFYQNVVFMRYDGSLASLLADDRILSIGGCKRRTKKDDTAQTDEEYVLDKLSLLKKGANEHTLLILDNYDRPVHEDPLWLALSEGGKYRLLVTTRGEPDRKKYFVLPVEEMDGETLRKLFIRFGNPNKMDVQVDDPGFPELFRLTNKHTYTLELLAKFMEEDDDIDTLEELIAFLKEHGFEDIHADGYENIGRLFRFTSLNEEEKYFLRCLAMLPAEGIPQKYFKKWIGEAWKARMRLVDRSLVKINGETRSIWLHPIIRDLIAKELQLSYDTCIDFVNNAAKVNGDVTPNFFWLSANEKMVLLHTFQSMLSYIPDITRDNYQFFVNASYIFNYAGLYSDSISLHNRIYQFDCQVYGSESYRAMLTKYHIVWEKCKHNHFEEAMDDYRMTSDWFFAHPCCANYDSLGCIRDYAVQLSIVYLERLDQELLIQAYDYLKKTELHAKNMQESEYDKNSIQVMIAYGYMQVYYADQRYDEMRAALDSFKKHSTESKEREWEYDSSTYYYHLARLEYAMKHFKKAQEAAMEAYRQLVKYSPETDPRLIARLEILSDVYVKLEDYGNAALYLTKAIDIAQIIFTPDHPTLLRLLDNKQQIEAHLDSSDH